jgi:hypothetical protein
MIDKAERVRRYLEKIFYQADLCGVKYRTSSQVLSACTLSACFLNAAQRSCVYEVPMLATRAARNAVASKSDVVVT